MLYTAKSNYVCVKINAIFIHSTRKPSFLSGESACASDDTTGVIGHRLS